MKPFYLSEEDRRRYEAEFLRRPGQWFVYGPWIAHDPLTHGTATLSRYQPASPSAGDAAFLLSLGIAPTSDSGQLEYEERQEAGNDPASYP